MKPFYVHTIYLDEDLFLLWTLPVTSSTQVLWPWVEPSTGDKPTCWRWTRRKMGKFQGHWWINQPGDITCGLLLCKRVNVLISSIFYILQPKAPLVIHLLWQLILIQMNIWFTQLEFLPCIGNIYGSCDGSSGMIIELPNQL